MSCLGYRPHFRSVSRGLTRVGTPVIDLYKEFLDCGAEAKNDAFSFLMRHSRAMGGLLAGILPVLRLLYFGFSLSFWGMATVSTGRDCLGL